MTPTLHRPASKRQTAKRPPSKGTTAKQGVVCVAHRGARASTVRYADELESARGSINLRIGIASRQIIDTAAAILGKSRTDFMIESATRQAIDVMLDQQLFLLSPEKHEAFVQALDNPPPPGPKLKSLMRRTPSWER